MMSAATAHSRLPQAVQLLSRLIATPSFSREEAAAADIWQQALTDADMAAVERIHNNVWAVAPGYDSAKPTLLLNSHLDTVRPLNLNLLYVPPLLAMPILVGRLQILTTP